jgi:drug/metabolite transporter (DMT)-like permease
VWGTTYLAIRVAVETLPPLLMAAARWIVAGTLLTAALAIARQPLPPRREWPSLAVLGVLLLGFGNGAVVWAELTVPSGLTAVLVATVPFWMVGTEHMRADGARLSGAEIAGLLIGFAGILLLVGPEIRFSTGRGFLAGVVSTQIACAGWAMGSMYARRRGHHENVLAAAALEMLFGGVALLAAGLALGEAASVAFSTRSVVATVYLIVAGSIGGFSAYAYALKHLPVAVVSLYAYVNPVIAVILGTVLLNEPFNLRMLLAAGIIFGGIALVRSSK